MNTNIWCASAPELSILANVISIYIAELYDIDDINTLAAFFTIIGDTLTLLAIQESRCEYSLNINNSINESGSSSLND